MKKTILLLAIAFIASATISSCKKEEIKPTYSDSGSSGSSGSGNTSGGSSGGSGCTTVQCSAYTQAGNRCQRMTTNCNGRCYQHQ